MNRKQQIKESRLRRSRRNRWLILVGVGVIAILVAALLIFENSRPVGQFDTIVKQTWPEANGKSLGSADAPVVVQEFADFQCPYCRQFFEKVEPTLIDEYVKTGKIRLEYHHFIVIDGNVGGRESRQAARASECALQQGDFWNYYAMLYTNQQGEGSGAFSDQRLKAFAEAMGYDTGKFNACLSSNASAQAVVADEALATSYRLNSTPSLVIGGTPIANPMDINAVKAAIDGALNAAQ